VKTLAKTCTYVIKRRKVNGMLNKKDTLSRANELATSFEQHERQDNLLTPSL
jgi:hypothetical protein